MSTSMFMVRFSTLNQFFLLVSLSLLLFAGGCSGHKNSPSLRPAESIPSYRSDISDPQAKALYSYGQFRLYATEEQWQEAVGALERAVAFDPESSFLKLLLAKTYLRLKMTGDAIVVLDQLLERDPVNIEGLELRGNIASLENDTRGARRYYEQALLHGSDSNDIRFRLAMVLARLKENAQAIQVLEELLSDVPDLEVAQLALARIYADSGQKEKALNKLHAILEKNPKQVRAALEYGDILESSAPEKALAFYQDFVKQNPQATAIRQRLVEYYLAQQQYETALTQLQEIRWQYPDNTQVSGQIGLLQLELHNWTSAEKEFRSLLAQNSHPDRNRYYLSLALAGQGKVDEAISELEKITGKNEISKLAKLQLAYLYNDQSDVDSAIDVLTEGLAPDLLDADIYYYLVALLGDNERLQQALSYAKDAVMQYPEDTRLLYQLGVLYEKQGRNVDAVHVMEQLLVVDENHADALNFLAYQLAESGTNLELALARAKRALNVKKSGYIIDTLGWIYYKLGRYGESRTHLEEAARLHPEDPVITEHLGDLYTSMNLWNKAIEAYRRVLELDAEASGVAEKLRRVEKN